MHELETDRLFFRPLRLEDATRVQPLFAQWEVVKFLNARVPWPYPEDGVATYYRDHAIPAMDRGDEWHWTLRLRESPEAIIGSIGLTRREPNDEDQINRGFWLGLPWQGKGLMTEAVIAANDYWFDVLGFRVLRVYKAIANTGSRRISEKTGMRMIDTHESEYVSGRLLSETWEITAEEWREKRIALRASQRVDNLRGEE